MFNVQLPGPEGKNSSPQGAYARQKLDEPDSDPMRVAVLEFVLEGLHLGKRLNKTALDGTAVYGG